MLLTILLVVENAPPVCCRCWRGCVRAADTICITYRVFVILIVRGTSWGDQCRANSCHMLLFYAGTCHYTDCTVRHICHSYQLDP
jgi:hypothetical protein